MVRESLHEFRDEQSNLYKDNYKLSGDPRATISKWFETYAPEAVYTVDENLNITVEGDLDLQGSQVKELPEGLISVEGYLNLPGSQITRLPKGLTTVGGTADLSGSQIKELPEGLTVWGSLYLSNSQITELPEDLKVKGTIWKNF